LAPVDPQAMGPVDALHRESVAGRDACHQPFIGTVAVPIGVMGGELRKRRTILHITSPPVFPNQADTKATSVKTRARSCVDWDALAPNFTSDSARQINTDEVPGMRH